MKKIIASATLLAASTMLASAASVAYTFNLASGTTVGSAINLAAAGIPSSAGAATELLKDSTKDSMEAAFGTGASLYVNISAGKLWGGASASAGGIDTSTIKSNSTAQEILGLTETDISNINYGVQDGAGGATTTFVVSGLSANTEYTLSMLVYGQGSGTTISWGSTGTLVSGVYAYGNAASTNITSGETSLSVSDVYAVLLTLQTDARGSVSVALTNGSSDSSNKIAMGYFGISQVPEPSAFGLLAGVGALALAVSRRRRSHK